MSKYVYIGAFARIFTLSSLEVGWPHEIGSARVGCMVLAPCTPATHPAKPVLRGPSKLANHGILRKVLSHVTCPSKVPDSIRFLDMSTKRIIKPT